ncbi:band 4.1-like protein 5 [Rhynchocyon petersi]
MGYYCALQVFCYLYSLPLNIDLLDSADLLETTIEDVIVILDTAETSQVPAEISIATKQTGSQELEVQCGTVKDVSEKHKQLETETSPLQSSHPNTGVAINSQVAREDSLLNHKNTATNSASLNEKIYVPEDTVALQCAPLTAPAGCANGSVLKDAADELDAMLLSLTESLIDQTRTSQVSSTSMVTPRWIVPQNSVLSNGFAERGVPLAGREGLDSTEGGPPISLPAPFLVDAVASTAPALAKEAILKHKCLLTTEL